MKKYAGKIIVSATLFLLFTVVLFVGYITPKVFAAGNGKYEFNVYGSYSNFYYRLVRFEDKLVWDNSNSVLSAAPTFSNTCIAVTIDQYVGGFPIDLPSTLPNGEYDFIYYDSATTVCTDVPVGGFRMIISNGKLATTPLQMQ